jgi:peptide deformylase
LEYPHAALRRRARKVRKIDKFVQALADDLIDTLLDIGGVGLAANQVGVLRRVIVIQLPEEEEPRVYFNPEIVHREGRREVEEGCLSIPGYHALIYRSILVRATGLDRRSRLIRLSAEGLLAQALEHELDHLNGIMYIDHLESHQSLIKNEPEGEGASAKVLAVV